MSIEEHVMMIGRNFFADEPYPIYPECTCGWEGRGVESIEDAQEAWDDHCDAVFIEATTDSASAVAWSGADWAMGPVRPESDAVG